MNIVVDGYNICYKTTGTGDKTVVILQGWGTDLGMISFDKAYVEMYEYPRGQKAVITYTEDGHTEEIVAGATADALGYEVEDMEQAIAGHPELMKLELTEDVMKMMTRIRKDWGLTYPEEERATEKI